MSGHDHAPSDSHDADSHDEHDEEHEAPPPAEPESPAWLPLLGGALFLAGLLLYLFTRTPDASAAAPEAAASAKAPAKPVASAVAANAAAARPQAARPSPSAIASTWRTILGAGSAPAARPAPPKE